MGCEYIIKKNRNSITIEDSKTEHSLHINPHFSESNDWKSLYFYAPWKNSKMLVTARDFSDYNANVLKIPIDSKFQYIEVGAGLGGFVQYVVEKLEGSCPRPIIIDPVNYDVLLNLLAFAENQALNAAQYARIKTLKARCNLFLDRTKVNVISAKLSYAVNNNSRLLNIADFVVDNKGPSLHTATEYDFFNKKSINSKNFGSSEKFIYELEKKLLKPSGKVISHYSSDCKI